MHFNIKRKNRFLKVKSLLQTADFRFLTCLSKRSLSSIVQPSNLNSETTSMRLFSSSIYTGCRGPALVLLIIINLVFAQLRKVYYDLSNQILVKNFFKNEKSSDHRIYPSKIMRYHQQNKKASRSAMISDKSVFVNF